MHDVALPDGWTVRLRPLTGRDGRLLRWGIAALTPRSRYLRFHSTSPPIGDREIAQLTDVDQADRAAWLVLAQRRGIAIGRYARLAGAPDTAEMALTVLDTWQRRGVAKLLVAALARTARAAGIRFLAATVLGDNEAALGLLAALGGRPAWQGDGSGWCVVATDPAAWPDTAVAREVRRLDAVLGVDAAVALADEGR